MNSIILIVLGVICLQVFCDETTESELPLTHKKCLAELNLPAEVLFSNFHKNFTVNEDVSDLNKIIYCVYKKENFLNEDDTVKILEFHNFLAHHFMSASVANIIVDNAEETATNAIDACVDVEGTDRGDTLVKNYNCIVKYLQNCKTNKEDSV